MPHWCYSKITYNLCSFYRHERKGLINLFLSGTSLHWGDGSAFTDTLRLWVILQIITIEALCVLTLLLFPLVLC